MKVAKLYRLLSKKDHQFITTGQKEEVRTYVIVSQNYIDEQNAISGDTGLYYEVDEEATQKRDSGKEIKESKEESKDAKKFGKKEE